MRVCACGCAQPVKGTRYSYRRGHGPTGLCLIEGCGRPQANRGWCYPHYRRWKRHGDPLAGGTFQGLPVEQRVEIDGSGCWVWRGARNTSGYGHRTRNGRVVNVHREMLERKLGRPLDVNELACHSCDNPPCVNPNHLFAGSASDNTRDMDAKGRRVAVGLPGTLNPGAKLTTGDVVEIRRLLATTPLLQREIGAMFGVTQSCISRLSLGRTYRQSKGDAA